MGEEPTVTDGDRRELASNYDMHDRLCATLATPDIDADVASAVVLQLAGGVAQEPPLGETIRGDIHVAVVAGADTNLSRFLSAVADLAPNSMLLNGHSATLAGVVGSVRGGTLEPGPLLDSEIDFTIIEGHSDSDITDALQQVIDAGTYSFAKSSFRETVPATGSLLMASNPKWGTFDPYEPLGQQLELPPAIIAGMDVIALNNSTTVTPVADDVDALQPEIARQYLTHARTLTPSLPSEQKAEREAVVQDITEAAETEDSLLVVNAERLRHSLTRLAQAHAKLRLGETVSGADMQRAARLLRSTLETLHVIDPTTDDTDLVTPDAGTSSDPDQIENARRAIADREDEHTEGVPISDAINAICAELDVAAVTADELIDTLRQTGKVYEPVTDHLRTT